MCTFLDELFFIIVQDGMENFNSMYECLIKLVQNQPLGNSIEYLRKKITFLKLLFNLKENPILIYEKNMHKT